MTMPLDAIPLWAFFLGTVLFVLGAIEVGIWLGKTRNRRPEHEKEPPVGAMVAAVLALLAFMLGFTFQMAATRFEARRTIVVDEANAVGTAWLRAGMLPAPQGPAIRGLLAEYVDVRIRGAETGQVAEAFRHSEELHGRLWEQAEAVGRATPGSIVAGLFIGSLNDVIDISGKRKFLTAQNRLPTGVWIALFGITALAMAAVGFQTGLSGSRRSPAALVLALAFSAVIWMIADLDRPLEGGFRVGQNALIDLRNSMQVPSTPSAPPSAPAPAGPTVGG